MPPIVVVAWDIVMVCGRRCRCCAVCSSTWLLNVAVKHCLGRRHRFTYGDAVVHYSKRAIQLFHRAAMADFSSYCCRSRSRWESGRVYASVPGLFVHPCTLELEVKEDLPTDVVLGFDWFQSFADHAPGHQCEFV